MPDENTNVALEASLTNKLKVLWKNEEYIFKIPSVQDHIRILGIASQIRREADPEGNGISLNYDPTATFLTEKLARFNHLLDATSAVWVLSPDNKGVLQKDMSKWDDEKIDLILEVIAEFDKALTEFRTTRTKS